MYRHLVANLSGVFGDHGRFGVAILLVLAGLALAMLLIPAWRRREKAAWNGEAKFPLLTLLLAAFIRLLLVGTVLGALSLALVVQRGLFAEKHGRVTQRNYEAVKTKWGVPHEQTDLIVEQFLMRKLIEEEFGDGSRRKLETEERQTPTGTEDTIIVGQETSTPVPEDNKGAANPARLVRRTTTWQRYRVDEDLIQAAQVEISLTSNPRTLGNASYAAYEDVWRLQYSVCNRTDFTTQARFRFPLPAKGYGVFDQLVVNLDNEDWISNVRYRDGELEWRMPMKPGEAHDVEIGYASRGLEYFRYKPRNMLERCLVTVNVNGIRPDELDYPIGSMPPSEDRRSLSGDSYALHWALSRAVTNLDVGIKLPTPQQPGYYVTALLSGAPVGLALLALVLLATRWLIGRRFDVLEVCLVLLAYYIGHALLANLNDVVRLFAPAFVIGLLPVMLVAAWLWYKVDGRGFLAGQSSVLVVVFAVLYPLCALTGETAGTLLHILYALLVMYVVGLVGWNAVRQRREQP